MGQLARTYFVNLMIFQSWGLLYAILQVLITALQMNSINAVLGGNGVLNAFVGSSQMVLLGAVSVLFAIAIALIPFIASRMVHGDVGNTVFALAAVVNRAARTALSSSISSQASSSGPPQAMPDPGPLTGGGPGGAGAGGEALAESRPPQPTGGAAEGGAATSAGEIGAAGAVAAV
jgi:hypothetical protein